MKIAVAYPVPGQPVEIGCVYVRSITPEVAEACVIQQDENHIGAPLAGAGRLGPVRNRFLNGPPDNTFESLIFCRHKTFLPVNLFLYDSHCLVTCVATSMHEDLLCDIQPSNEYDNPALQQRVSQRVLLQALVMPSAIDTPDNPGSLNTAAT